MNSLPLLLILGFAWVSAVSVAPAHADTTAGDCSPIVRDTQGNVEINISCPIQLTPVQLRELIESIRTPGGASPSFVSEFRNLSARFGVTETALKNFFKILERESVSTEELDNTLRKVAQRHLELLADVQRVKSDEPEVQAIRDQALAAIEAADYDRAETLLKRVEEADLVVARRAQEEAERRFLSAAATRAQRGQVQLAQLRYAEAAAHFQQAADLVPSDHPLVQASYLNSAGNAWHDAGRYAQALPALEEALLSRERELDPKHLDVAASLNNLASLYWAQGKYAETEPLLKRALAIKEKVLGPEHPSVAQSLENYATLLRKTGRNSEAAKLEARAKPIRAKHAEQNPAN